MRERERKRGMLKAGREGLQYLLVGETAQIDSAKGITNEVEES